MSSSLRLGRVATPDSWSAVTMEAREAPDAWADAIIRESTVFPSSGNAANGKPIFNWDQAAAQLTRGGFTWSPTLGQGVTVTYAFRSTAPTTMPDGVDGFTRFNAAQITAAEAALQLWADVANITFVRVGSGTTGENAYSNNATILFSNYTTETDNAAGFAYLPSPGATGASQVQGDIWIDNTEAVNQTPVFGDYGMQVLAHEIGHAIGMRHPSDYDGGSPTYDADATWWQDSRLFTIMSYFGSLALGGSLGAFAAGPQLLDIAGAQRLYGANMSTRTGDTIYGFNSNTGRQHYTITSASQAAVFSIWDGGGNDTLDFSGYTQGGEIDLRPEGFSGVGPGNGGGTGQYNISIARGVIIENAIGGSGAENIIGNTADNRLLGNGGNDTLDGGDGADTLDGGAGADRLVGGLGNDILLFDNLDTLDGGAGTDYANASGSGAGVSVGLLASALEGAWGSAFADTLDSRGLQFGTYLVGNGGNDTLYTGAGADVVNGGDGNDVLYIDQIDTFDGGAGTDYANAAYATAGVSIVLQARGLEGVWASAYNDMLDSRGLQFGTYLIGYGGADTIYTGAGADVIQGGDGNDLLFFDQIDSVDGGAGTDYGNAAYATAGINVVMTARGLEGLWASAYNDVIDARGLTSGAYLVAYGGADTIYSGGGADQIDGGAGGDVVIYGGAQSLYTITQTSPGVWTVARDGITDTVTGVETLRFDSGDFLLT